MTTVSGKGNSNEENYYDYLDNDSGSKNIYYRLSQTDFSGNKQTFELIAANCFDKQIEDDFIIINNPAGEQVQLQLSGAEGNQYILSFIDQLGRQLIEKHIYMNDILQTITINTSFLSKGIYSVVFRSKESFITKQLVIIK